MNKNDVSLEAVYTHTHTHTYNLKTKRMGVLK